MDLELDDAPPPARVEEPSPIAQLQRLKTARLNQEKASAILRALEALLAEKGYR